MLRSPVLHARPDLFLKVTATTGRCRGVQVEAGFSINVCQVPRGFRPMVDMTRD